MGCLPRVQAPCGPVAVGAGARVFQGLVDAVAEDDLARATGQECPGADEAVVAEPAGAVDELAPTARKTGVFGEPVAEPEGASAFERLLARTGRDPHWR